MIMIGDRKVIPAGETELYRGDKMLFPYRQATDSELTNINPKLEGVPIGRPDPYVYLNINAQVQRILEQETPIIGEEKEYSEAKKQSILRLAKQLFGEDDGGGDDGGDVPGGGDNNGGNGGSGGNESGGGDIPSTTTTYSTFTLDDGTVEKYKINGVLDNDWMVANGFKRIETNGMTTWVKNIVKASIGTGVTAFGLKVFMSSTLSEITIPNSVTDIGELALAACKSLKSVTIPNSVTNIGVSAFQMSIRLTSATIGNGVTSIGENMFYYCTSLSSVTIPNSVTSIGKDAFYKCSFLTSVTIPDSVTNIGNSAFYGCNRLTSITFYGKTMDDVKAMNYYPWGIQDVSIITNVDRT